MKLCLRCNQYFDDDLQQCPTDQAQLESVGKDPLIGALINDRYVVESVIGKGSSGIVYKATRLLMGREVAVKVIHSFLGADSASLDRFVREIRAAERLRHPHIITIWESGTTDDGQPYLVMDYLEGITLADLVKQKGALHPSRVLHITKQVCEAIGEAHKQGLIHRDLKPENIILQETDMPISGDTADFVKVLDFGIADTPQESASRTQFSKPKTVAGSPAYMSPEQCQGFALDHRSDLYSLGVIVYEMFCGVRPFDADDLMGLMYMTVSAPPPKMGELRPDMKFSDRVEAVLQKALAKSPDQRYDSTKDFWKDLEEASQGGEVRPSREVVNVSEFEFDPSEMLLGGGLTSGVEMPAKRPSNPSVPNPLMPPPPPPRGMSISAAMAGASPMPVAQPQTAPTPPGSGSPTPQPPPPPSLTQPTPPPVPSNASPNAAPQAAPQNAAPPPASLAPPSPSAPAMPAGGSPSLEAKVSPNITSRLTSLVKKPGPPGSSSSASAQAPSNGGGSQAASDAFKTTAKPAQPFVPPPEAKAPSVYSYVPPPDARQEAVVPPKPAPPPPPKPAPPAKPATPPSPAAPGPSGQAAPLGATPPAPAKPGEIPPPPPNWPQQPTQGPSQTPPGALVKPAAGATPNPPKMAEPTKALEPSEPSESNAEKEQEVSEALGKLMKNVNWESEMENLQKGTDAPSSFPAELLRNPPKSKAESTAKLDADNAARTQPLGSPLPGATPGPGMPGAAMPGAPMPGAPLPEAPGMPAPGMPAPGMPGMPGAPGIMGMPGIPVDPNMAGQFTGQHPQYPGPGQMTGQHQQYPGPGQMTGQHQQYPPAPGQMTTGQHQQFPGPGQVTGQHVQYPGYPPPDMTAGQAMQSYPGFPPGYPPPGYPQGYQVPPQVPPGYPPAYPPMMPPGYPPGYQYMPVDPSQMGMPPQQMMPGMTPSQGSPMMPGMTPPQGTQIPPGMFGMPPQPGQPGAIPGQPGAPGQPGVPPNHNEAPGFVGSSGNSPMEDSGKKPSRSKALGELLKKVSESDTPSPTSTAARLKALVEQSYAGPLPTELTERKDESKGPPPSRSEVLSQLMRAVTDSPDSMVTPAPNLPPPPAPAPTPSPLPNPMSDPPVKKGLGLGSLLASAEPAPEVPKGFGGTKPLSDEDKPFGFSSSISNSIGSLNQVPEAENAFSDAIDKLFDEPAAINVDKALKEASEASQFGSSDAFNAVSGLMGTPASEPVAQKPVRPLDASDSRVDALSRLLEAAQKAPEKPPEKPGEDPKISRSSALNRMLDAVSGEAPASANTPGAGGGNDPFHAPDPFRGGTGDVVSGPYGTPSTPPPSPNMRKSQEDPTASKTSQEAISARIEALNKKLEMSSNRQAAPEDMLASMLQQSQDSSMPMDTQDVEPPSRAAVMNRILEQANFAESSSGAGAPEAPPPPTSQAKYSANDLQALQKNKTKAQKKTSKKTAKQKMSGPGIDWRTPVLVIAVLAIGGGGFFAYQQGLIPGLSPKAEQGITESSDQGADVQALLDEGKYGDVRKALEKKQKDTKGKLSPTEIDQLSEAYIGLAKESSDEGKYTDAYTLLQKVSSKSSHYAEAKKLAAEAKSKAKPAKKKRRKR